MKKSHILQTVSAVVWCLVFTTYAAPQWQPLGLDSHSVNCLAIDDMGNVIAATQSGLYLCYNGTWYIIENQGLSAQKVIVTGPTRLVAAYGDGTDSDGFYEGNVTLLGAPFYTIKLVGYMERPTALTKTDNSQVAYIGNSVSIEYSILDTGGSGYMPLQPIGIPPNSFGVTTPFCAALHVYSQENCLYAGGYDRSPEPGPSYLLWGQGDSLKKFMSLNIGAITEGIIDWGGVKLFVGTIDTGIFYRTPPMSMPLQKHSESPNNEPVDDIIILSMSIDASPMRVAVKSGVYRQVGLEWSEIGDIPAEPKCLAFGQNTNGFGNALYAGTNKGVYVFDSSNVATKQSDNCLPEKSISIANTRVNDDLVISFSLLKSQRVVITLFDMSGRTVAILADRYFAGGKHTISWPEKSSSKRDVSSGVYIVRMQAGNTIYDMNVVFTK